MGSFLNVVASRTVDGRPWWGTQRSSCDSCGKVLGVLELIPLVSWLLQRGRCKSCGARIPARYPLAEAVSAVIGVSMAMRWGVSPAALLALLTGYFLLLNALTDIYSGYVYDLFAWGLGVVGLGFRLFGGMGPVLDGLLGMLLGGGLIVFIIFASRGGMGWGDASLMAGAGLALGWKLTAAALYAGFMFGGVVAVAMVLMKKAKRKDSMPLGPFLALGGIAALIYGPAAVAFFGRTPGWPWG